ncbi:MAG TPA: tetratricopeptide repeat protein [Phycisphaerae bacterium]|nr:tetratricopeptide repeat protein [Phycisphaerae bacterium]
MPTLPQFLDTAAIALRQSDFAAAEDAARAALPLATTPQDLLRLTESAVTLINAQPTAPRFALAYDVAAKTLPHFPAHPDLHIMLGLCAQNLGRLSDAARHYENAIRLDPASLIPRVNLAALLRSAGNLDESLHHLLAAHAKHPDNFELLYNLALTLRALQRLPEAIDFARRAAALHPDNPAITNDLALCLQQACRSDEALALLETFVARLPTHQPIWATLGSLHFDRGDLDRATNAYRHAVTLNPAHTDFFSNLVNLANYDDRLSPQQLFDIHRQWAAALPTVAPSQTPSDPTPTRRLRVGYVSSDFRTHSVAFFLEPLLAHHDHTRFEIFCYASFPPPAQPDAVTRRLQTHADHWRDISTLTTGQTFHLIQQDRIDILVDLAGHTAHNHLPLFHASPAPVQVSMIGYPNTTGLTQMDYQLTDAILHPPTATESFATEKLLRLPIFACYQPPPDAPPVAPLPSLSAGHITFGSFNQLAKLRPPILHAWAKIAAALPAARFILQHAALADPAIRAYTRDRCAAAGLPPDRLLLKPADALLDFLANLRDIDIALDSWPFNGHTTSCQLLHMGVPFVTLAGQTRPSRMGASLLTHLGLEDLIASTPDDYARIAITLAQDTDRLATLRATLRPRMESSPLMNAARFTRELENAFHTIRTAAPGTPRQAT